MSILSEVPDVVVSKEGLRVPGSPLDLALKRDIKRGSMVNVWWGLRRGGCTVTRLSSRRRQAGTLGEPRGGGRRGEGGEGEDRADVHASWV